MVFVAGLVLVLYPSVSNYWNSFHASQAISGYAEAVARLDADRYVSLIAAAEEYNAEAAGRENIYKMSEAECRRYEELLNVAGDGVMGYIEIPKIGVSLPVYHGTGDSVLQVAVGHIEWTSLPVGGEGTHCVLSGHRGLPSARLFTDIDKLESGDTFILRILGNTLTYTVDQIRIVLPEDTKDLQIEEGKDLCTLVTCTPYGINSHRLLVRGIRAENAGERANVNIVSEAGKIPPELTAAALGVPMLCLVYTAQIIFDSLKKTGKSQKRRNEYETGTTNYADGDYSYTNGDNRIVIQSNMQRKSDDGFKKSADGVHRREKSERKRDRRTYTRNGSGRKHNAGRHLLRRDS